MVSYYSLLECAVYASIKKIEDSITLTRSSLGDALPSRQVYLPPLPVFQGYFQHTYI